MTANLPDEIEQRHTVDERHRVIVRLIAGAIGEGVDRLIAVSRDLDEADADPVSASKEPIHADPTLMAIVGLMSELPQQIRNVRQTSGNALSPLARLSGVVFDTGRYLADTAGITSFLDGLTEPTRKAWAEERERLTSVGTGEYARGRVLAAHVFERSIDGILALVSESDELDELVRDQTIGITGSAVREIRETGAAADLLTERFFRRILGRETRPLPPKPVGDSAGGNA
jgi:hypothetical protein